MRQAFREAYVQRDCTFQYTCYSSSTECGYKLSSEKELKIQYVAVSAFPPFIGKEERKQKKNLIANTDTSKKSGNEELSNDKSGEESHNKSDDESEGSFDEYTSSSDEE